MRIREARASDVEAMSRVLVASITELCRADHGGDETNIARWTANKTPASLSHWMSDPETSFFVAEEADAIVGVGACRGAEVQLTYVAPAHRFRGMSKAMLQRLEEEMRKRGVKIAKLTSTATAHRFYRSAGWADAGEPQEMFGFARAQPMTKLLSDPALRHA
jgi:GNAT superfamily N-acetyltransferase